MKGSTLQINRQYEAALQAAPPTAGSLALVLRENARRGDVTAVAKYFKTRHGTECP
ncbi:hypothetical protein DIPPA_09962 [Diplonema papillatum]|nr:hypothetical protein DIPPA_09962 [Diplonema papillatum]